jgi:hypothetical protein
VPLPVPLVPVPLVPVPLVPVPLVPVPPPDPPERPPPVGSVGDGAGVVVVVVELVVVCVGVELVVVVLWPLLGVAPLDVDPVEPWLVAGPPTGVGLPPATGFAKWPPPLLPVVWLEPGVPGPPVVGVDGVLGCVLAGVLGAVVVELLGAGAVGAGWVPVPNVPVPMYGELPLVPDCPDCGVVGCAGATPTGATGTRGLMIGFDPTRPVGESGCSTSTRVVVEARLS